MSEPTKFEERHNRFFALLEEKEGDPDLPDWLAENWALIGNAVHQIIDCSCVYLMICRERGSDIYYVKVGKANDVKQRMIGLSIACPLELKKAIYFPMYGDHRAFDVEKAVHREFAGHRVGGEWFQFKDGEEAKRVMGQMMGFISGMLGGGAVSFVHNQDHERHEHMSGIKGFIYALWGRATIDERVRSSQDAATTSARPELF